MHEPSWRANGIQAANVIDKLHLRLVAGDEVAIQDLWRVLMPLLRAQVRRLVTGTDSHLIDTAIDDAYLAYLRDPWRFDRSRGTLLVWLVTMAANRARDLRRQMRRREAHEVTSGIDLSRLLPRGAADSVAQRNAAARDAILRSARDARERAFLAARLAGASVRRQAAALGVTDQPLDRLRRVVYRALDRIAKRARRNSAR